MNEMTKSAYAILKENNNMLKIFVKYTSIALLIGSCASINAQETTRKLNSTVEKQTIKERILPAAENFDLYLPKLIGKKIGVVTNQTGILRLNNETIHLVDFLLKNEVNVIKIFSPEHGFRGDADAGVKVNSSKDAKTGLPIVSLYGNNRKPTLSQLTDIDILLFDMQDVGVRFYTYISTLHYVMQAAAESNKKVIVLDRPNPNGHYVDGPVMKPEFTSFVGMHPVPIVYGMTIGEYAQMIDGEGWLDVKNKLDLEVIPIAHYTHRSKYSLPVKPSPNLPNDKSINLYPSVCLFEGTQVNEGRGTDMQFQVYGSPHLKNMPFQYTPVSKPGASEPKFKNQRCYGEDLRDTPDLDYINLDWLIKAYQNNTKQPFWTKNGKHFWIDQLAGTDELRKQIEEGWTAEQIKATWQKDLEKFKTIRAKYLIYRD